MWLVLGVLSAAAAATGLAWFVGARGRETAKPAAAPAKAGLGPADACKRGPRFSSSLGLGQQVAVATTLNRVRGLALIDNQPNAPKPRIYRHESWDDAGYLGPFVTDEKGYIYAAPVPRVSVTDNPPELQNRVYRVDTDTQVMSLFADLPAVQLPSGANPFGVVALAYDCDTHSLYASSLAGSTAKTERGRIFQIDVHSGTVVSQSEGVDAFGIGVFNGAGGKRLYYGLARKPELYSVALDAAGRVSGTPRFELSTVGSTQGGRNKIRRIRFGPESRMTLFLRDFAYTLQAASAREEDELHCTYEAGKDAWTPDAGGAVPASQSASQGRTP